MLPFKALLTTSGITTENILPSLVGPRDFAVNLAFNNLLGTVSLTSQSKTAPVLRLLPGCPAKTKLFKSKQKNIYLSIDICSATQNLKKCALHQSTFLKSFT